MTQLELPVRSSLDASSHLSEFFSNLEDCRDKSAVTHGLHPYPAKFIPHIPRELIRSYSMPGDLVWDPMCGSGTTLVEAMLEGRNAVGTDINPVAALASRAKTTPLTKLELVEARQLASKFRSEAQACTQPGWRNELVLPEFHNRDHWFDKQVCRELQFAKELIGTTESPHVRDLALCVFSSLIVPFSNQESETRWRAKRRDVSPGQVVEKLGLKLSAATDAVIGLAEISKGEAEVRCVDARESELSDETVDLVVTSPPYANSHDYYLYNKLRLFWLGFDVAPIQDQEIGSRNKHSDRKEGIETYLEAIAGVLAEVRRTLTPRGVAVIVVGDAVIRGEFYPMDSLMRSAAEAAELELEEQFAFDHRRFNRTFQKGFGTAVKKSTHVLVLRRA